MNEFSHKKITEVALKDVFSNLELEEIIKGAILPDKDENQKGYVYHFYNPVTKANYLGNEFHAKAKCIYHLGKYIKTKDLVELGRAIHFLEDICTPVHTQYEDSSDSILKLKLHLDFEKELDNVVVSKMEFIVANLVLLNKGTNSLSNFIDNIALKSAKNYYIYRKYGKRSNVLIETIKNAYKSIYNFVNEYVFKIKEKQVKEIISKENKEVIGIIINEGNNNINAETINSNYKLRISENEVLIFKKGGALKNYELEEVIEIE